MTLNQGTSLFRLRTYRPQERPRITRDKGGVHRVSLRITLCILGCVLERGMCCMYCEATVKISNTMLLEQTGRLLQLTLLLAASVSSPQN